MEKNITATFKKVNDLELAADELRRQGVLDIQCEQPMILIDYQAHTLIQTVGDYAPSESYDLHVCVELSRYRQAEDTITKYRGEL
ncbi:hypothetical protein D3C73_525350 [compost metagenome]